jgi:hypothetical protein
MRSKFNLPLLVLVCVLCAVIGWTVRAQKPGVSAATPAPARASWEYKIVSESDKVALNDLGAQGWELVAVTNGGAEEVYYFKRAK